MVVGAAKAGTTSLCALLGSHPEVFMTEPKEPRFFSWDEFYARGVDWYESLYADAGDARMRGEGSQSYTLRCLFPKTAERIARYAPELKLIYIVRHPLERMESSWLQLRSWDYGRLRGFLKNARVGPSIVHPDFNEAMRRNVDSYLESSNYWREINVYRDYFPDEQILVLFFDDFKRDAEGVLQQCWDFLGVAPDVRIANSSFGMNEASRKRFQGPIYWYLLNMPGLDLIYRATNYGTFWKKLNGRLVSHPASGRPRWDPALRKDVVASLRPDIETFLDFYGRSRALWQLDAES